MKHIILIAALCIFPGATMTAQADPQQDATLRAILQQQAEAWNRGDAPAWASSFTGDASFVNVRGDAVTGRPAIEAIHRMIFSTFYKGSHTTVTVDSIRYLSPTIAVIDTVHEVAHIATLPPGIAATEPGVLRARLRYIAVREADTWKFVAAQNTAISPKPLAISKP